MNPSPAPSDGSAPAWRELTSPAQIADALIALYTGRGAANYDEILSQTEHALQAGHLASAAGSADDLVVAAFLHDVGHLLMGEQPAPTEDRRHEDVGARFLANWFPATVTTPVRLHVAAKRYLCAVEPGYADGLSAGSTRSLVLQGGPMTDAEVVAFEAVPGSEDAVAVRRWDDHAKTPDASTPGLSAYRDVMIVVLTNAA